MSGSASHNHANPAKMTDSVLNSTDGKPVQMNKKRNRKETASYPPPLVILPAASHTQTTLLLHGRGSNTDQFGPTFLESKTADGKRLQEVLPTLKFIFPTAKKRRAKWYNRATISQWFDNVPVDEQDDGMSREEVEWQLDGLRETREFLLPILDAECKEVGANNMFIGGLSQGCAMALHLLMSWQGIGDSDTRKRGKEALGGFIGMSGWLPFAKDIEAIVFPERDDGFEEDEDNPFTNSDDEGKDEDDDTSVGYDMRTSAI